MAADWRTTNCWIERLSILAAPGWTFSETWEARATQCATGPAATAPDTMKP